MVSPLLETKLYVPRWRRGLVPRPRLSERLNRGAESKLTLVSAPAGFGKTTLLAEWLAATPAEERSAAWVSLDQSDNHARTFWTYFIAALRTVEPSVGANAIALLQSAQPAPIEAVLTLLLNELSAISNNEVVLVLDDYHVIDAREIHDGMVFLLDHLPPRMHLVIASRADPPLPLARLRARGELVEIRAEDLRFAADEAASYFHESMGLDLTARDVAVLEGRTEGWIAALQLAALSMQGRSDITGFIASFAGDDRYIVDYLVEEVLQRQPDTVRSFLRDTSILDRLSGPLCDAVTGRTILAKRCWRRWSERTCSWSRSTIADAGIDTTISLATCCVRVCWASSQTVCPSCTGGRAPGTSATTSRRRRSATRSRPATFPKRRT